MKISTKLSPVAIAVAALCLSPLAFAGSSSSAVSNSLQNSHLNVGRMKFDSPTTATVDGSVLQNAAGNLSLNVASGLQNQQSNAAAITKDSSKWAKNQQAQAANSQDTYFNYDTQISDTSDDASLSGNAMRGASGNINSNIASGVFNQQHNGLAIVSGKDGMADASSANSQMSSMYSLENYYMTNNAGLSGYALSGATGNVGANIASGMGNQQSNNLSVASVKKGSANAAIGSLQGLTGAPAPAPETSNPQYVISTDLDNNASISGNALTGASGNVGVNIASGDINQQANNTAISRSGGGSMATAVAAAGQQMTYLDPTDTGVQDSATINGHAGQGASGNIALNVAAGAENQQQNGLAMAVASNAAMGTATAPVEQVADFNGGNSACSDYNSTVSGYTLTGATGNISLNVASGNGNQQTNTLAIASSQ